MIRRENRQAGLADSFARPSTANPSLDRIDRLVNWEPLRLKMERFYSPNHSGRPAFPVVMLFKAILLQTWYCLSDPAAEEAIDDRRSFRRFLGLSLEEKAPDHSTLHRFRDRIAPVMEQLLAEVNRQIDAKGLILRKGTLVDATLIQAAGRPTSGADDTPHDPDARWGGKGDDPTYGYKGHIGLDQDSELIRRANLTPANQHDGSQFEAMISGDEEVAYADKAYASQERSNWLQQHGIEDGILFKAARGRPLTPLQKKINRELTAVRRNVEHVFGTMKRIYAWRRCRYFNYERNRCSFLVLCIAYNLRRTIKLQSA
jgi:IS5 family transposase